MQLPATFCPDKHFNSVMFWKWAMTVLGGYFFSSKTSEFLYKSAPEFCNSFHNEPQVQLRKKKKKELATSHEFGYVGLIEKALFSDS